MFQADQTMEIRHITPEFAVSPQLEPNDMAALAAEGFVAVINNRPDMEVPPELRSRTMRAAAQAAGMTYVDNPVVSGGMTSEMVALQREATESRGGPVLAWCRTGTRSAVAWAFGQAGRSPTSTIMEGLARAGYTIPELAHQIDMLATSGMRDT